jgi:glutamate-1-semialdehyde 2,1-aminomutase
MAPLVLNSNEELWQRALAVLVGGVNSPVRAFTAVGGHPPVITRAAGAHLFDASGRAYLDCIGSWGAAIWGHCPDFLVQALAEQAARGFSYGLTSELEIFLAEKIRSALPAMEKIRFVNSGTEAAMSAVRLARAVTNRELVLKFDGGYHGHADSFLTVAGSGLATLGLPACPGIPAAIAERTLSVPYNDISALEQTFVHHGNQIAAVILELVPANMGVVLPDQNFLEAVQTLSRRHGALLIADEVITGFRLRWGGAQQEFGIVPDLTLLGKIIGGGLPVGAYGGRADLMRHVAPEGPVYQAGTLSGNPLAMRCGLATLEALERQPPYDRLENLARQLAAGLEAAAAGRNVFLCINRYRSLLTAFFTAGPVKDYTAARRSDLGRFARFFRAMLERNILWPPSQFEAVFLSAAHTEADIARITAAAEEALAIATRDAAASGV